MVVKVYISGISGNKEVKKRQQRVTMILESKNIPFEVVDITEPGKEEEKDFMQNNSTSLGITVSDTNPRHPLPPQIYNDAEYCGDYDLFDLANEVDTLEQFLKVEPPKEQENNEDVGSKQLEAKQKSLADGIDAVVEEIARNGITSSREASVEVESKPNGDIQSDEVDETVESEKEDIVIESNNLKKDLSPSEDLILSEQATAE